MREIKFRAWDKIIKKMFPVEQWCNKSWVAVPVQDSEDDWHLEQRKLDDIELQQFTGLLDKKGVEIFEGDIVKYSSYRFGKNGKDELKTQNGEIYWLNNSFEVKWIVPIDWVAQEYKLDPSLSKETEVIGNVFENENLLTPKQ